MKSYKLNKHSTLTLIADIEILDGEHAAKKKKRKSDEIKEPEVDEEDEENEQVDKAETMSLQKKSSPQLECINRSIQQIQHKHELELQAFADKWQEYQQHSAKLSEQISALNVALECKHETISKLRCELIALKSNVDSKNKTISEIERKQQHLSSYILDEHKVDESAQQPHVQTDEHSAHNREQRAVSWRPRYDHSLDHMEYVNYDEVMDGDRDGHMHDGQAPQDGAAGYEEAESHDTDHEHEQDEQTPNVMSVASEILMLKEELKSLQMKVSELEEEKDRHGYRSKQHSKQCELRAWLRDEVGLSEYFDVFVENGFENLEAVKMLTLNELNVIGIEKLGHKMLLLHHIKQLQLSTFQHTPQHEGKYNFDVTQYVLEL